MPPATDRTPHSLATRRTLVRLFRAASAVPAALAVALSPLAAQSPSHTTTDSAFMAGMIGHHAQAIVMANLAPDRASSEQVRILAARVIVSQRDEIAAMQSWLAHHGLPLPDTSHQHAGHGEGLMPGMLSPAQLGELEAARCAEFDRLFVTLMIQHHQGALTMVDQLLQSPGAHDSFVFRVAADVHADQTAEIERMARLLLTLPLPGSRP